MIKTAARSILAIAALAIPTVRVGAQQSAPAEFDVASIKPNKSGEGGMSINTTKGLWRATNITPEWLIINSYDVLPEQIISAPQWIHNERFDIEGHYDPEQTIPGFEKSDLYKARLQALLATRFQFQLHRETKDWQSYILIAGKNGPKLKASQDGGSSMRSSNGHLECKGMTMENLASNLAFHLGRPVVDQTGLAGRFDFTLDYEEEGQQPETHAPSLFAALQDQLGLKLDAKKAPVKMLVVDRIEQPSAN